MNEAINGYQLIETIHTGAKTVIYRGKKESAPGEAIVKTLKAEYPTLEEIARLRHEYQILQSLNLSGTIKTLALENYGNGVAIILEEFGSRSLEKLLAVEKPSLFQFLKYAIKLTETLVQVHQHHIIHKDIKPHNILLDEVSGQIKLIDFSIATRLNREQASISNPNLLEGTLAYMAPEQTGRMNRSIDYRTDFYSLGITFYEMLTGQLPFTTTDPMELVHCHIAQIPAPPQQVNPEIPAAISQIVMKLMAKNAEDRYQSARGLKADLEEFLFQWETLGKIENFIPGERDKSGQFLIPQKLYGRSAEVAELMAAFDRASSGTAELMLVSGYSGVGKTAVVNEVHKPIVRQRGYFIAGKFEQMGRNVPYAALLQAFRELVRQLLTESSEQIATWKEELLEALGENARVITDTIPEVELIIGSVPEVPELGATESQNRFNRTFKQFVRVFTKPEHPLVLFLDDLQWADLASLKLIQLLVTDSNSQHLLLIGAYRDNEVSPTHPTIGTIEQIEEAGAAVNNIFLAPLNHGNVSLLVADTLQEAERSKELAQLLFNKTQGNPFFLTQLLNTLYQEGLILFDFTEGRWLWDIDRIQAIGIADYTVVELVARNIQKLPAQTQEKLTLAACMGNLFHLDVLAVVNQESLLTAAEHLWEALQAGLILPLNNAYKIPLFVEPSQQEGLNFSEIRVSYKFLHDRVQQAAYSLIPESKKKATHLKIGRLLLEKTSKYLLTDNIFDIVNQLNIGVEFIIDLAERERLASLNLMAGKKAKGSTAYEAASEYLNMGLELLPEASWDSHYELTRDLHVEALAASYLTVNFERASQLSDVVLEHAKTQLEKVKIYELKITYYISQNEPDAALEKARQVLQMLETSLPQKPSNLSIMLGLICTKVNLGSKRVEDLAELPQMTDPYKLAAMRILMAVIPAAFASSPMLFPLVVFKMIGLSLKYGNSPLSAYGYCMYGMLLCGVLGDVDNGYQFGLLAVKLLEQLEAKELKAKIYMLYNQFVRQWKEHISETIEPFMEAFQSGIENGDIEYACNAAGCYCYNLFWMGKHLDYVNKNQTQYIEIMLQCKQEMSSSNMKMWKQVFLNLVSQSEKRGILIGESFNEETGLPELIKANNRVAISFIYLGKSFLYYLFKDYVRALDNARLTAQYKENLIGTIQLTQHNLYYSLALLARYPNVAKDEQKQYLKKVVSYQKQMKKWATHSPCNFQHKYELVEAEKARVLGQETNAMALYDSAIAGAKENGYVHEEAIANELAAEFHLGRGSEKIAKTYMTEAYYGYIRWGAKAKVKDLEERYPQLISRSERSDSESSILKTTVTTTSSTGENAKVLDLATVVKASQAISGEIVPSRLLEKMMTIVIENAGARSGCLLVKHEGQWVREASGTLAGEEVTVQQSSLAATQVAFPVAPINYVERTGETLVIDNASDFGQSKSNGSGLSPSLFQNDPYIQAKQPQSILCLPIVHHGKLSGILYLENDLIAGAFTKERVEILNLLSSQISISTENARLYAREREKSQQLAESLQKLQHTQTQLVHTEKISSLGQLVAGVAHEVNNPVGFISGNVHHAREYVQNLTDYLELYQKHYPNPPKEIVEMAEEIDLEFIREDLPNMLASMQLGTDRIREIMQSLRNFSRTDKGKKKPADIHTGLESTLMILGHRLKAKPERSEIKVVKEYGSLPKVMCFSGQLNQVFMNLMANAIDAMEEAIYSGVWQELHGDGGREQSAPFIRIRTEVRDSSRVAIMIKDNGPGMPEEVRSKLFGAFFTTKPEGKGTGLGLSISYQIVTEKHGGTLRCESAPGKGAEFIIDIPIDE